MNVGLLDVKHQAGYSNQSVCSVAPDHQVFVLVTVTSGSREAVRRTETLISCAFLAWMWNVARATTISCVCCFKAEESGEISLIYIIVS